MTHAKDLRIRNAWVRGSNPLCAPASLGSVPGTFFTDYTGGIVSTFAAKGLGGVKGRIPAARSNRANERRRFSSSSTTATLTPNGGCHPHDPEYGLEFMWRRTKICGTGIAQAERFSLSRSRIYWRNTSTASSSFPRLIGFNK